MAKINHYNIIDTINDMLIQAKKRGIIHLNFESETWDGKHLQIGEKSLINFGTCGYLGLEVHPKIIEYVNQFSKDFGAQFSVSRAYLTSRKNHYLEELLSEMYMNKHVLAFSSTTIAHIAVLPIVVDHDDVIILDQQAHVSIQTAAQLMAAKGVPVEMIRHSNLDMLESKIQTLRSKYKRIWYMVDGVYSMFGDIAPIHDINCLLKKYEQLHLYVDDAHGMSWYGTHGCGRIFEQTVENQRTIYVSTMAKGFGTMGGTVIFPTKEWYEKVALHGGPLAYSHPIPPPMMGASIASAEIHLTDEIYAIQRELKAKISYANSLLSDTFIPVLSNPETPIYFIGTGQPNVGYNLNKRILDDGFYVNIGMFPAVPVKNTGLRFTITNHNTEAEIGALIESILYHYPKVLEEEEKSINSVLRAFRLPMIEEQLGSKIASSSASLKVQQENSILKIDSKLWDECFFNKGNFDRQSLIMLEKAYKGNDLVEENWDFYYIIIKDNQGKIVLATHLTAGLFKDDLLALANVSKAIEQKRNDDKYFLCSKMLIMGSLFSEGDHLFLDKSHSDWKEAVKLLLDSIHIIQDRNDLNGIILRDFDEQETELADIFHDAGFFMMKMPNSNILFDLQKDNSIDFIDTLTKRARKNIRQDVMRFSDSFEVKVKQELTQDELNNFYSLYSNVGEKNREVNIFKYPMKLFEEINKHPNWEFIQLINKENLKISTVLCAYKTKDSYFPTLIGIDYEENEKSNVYKQIIYQTALHSRREGYEKIHFGLSADVEKRKLGAKQIVKNGFMFVRDQFNLELLDKISVT